MRVKKFVGKTMHDAVEEMRSEFGNDAVILHTSQKRAWFWGRLGPKRYEVLGAFDPSSQRQAIKSRPKMAPQQVANRYQNPVPQPKPEQREMQQTSHAPQEWNDTIQSLYARLVRVDIPGNLARKVLTKALSQVDQQDWHNEEKIWSKLQEVIRQAVVTVEPWEFNGKQKIVVLIGPTGVGKTTTIAKLAANFSLIGGTQIGLITVDTYRIAAVEQLKTYAEIINLPVHVAYSPQELKDGIARLEDKDLILIDTAGRSQNNQLQIAELKSYLDGIEAEIHLVLSATTKPRDVEEIIESFSKLAIDRLIITKLDETTAYGMILQACEQAQAPLAFVTTGQGVPEDIDVASGERIAQLILGDSEL